MRNNKTARLLLFPLLETLLLLQSISKRVVMKESKRKKERKVAEVRESTAPSALTKATHQFSSPTGEPNSIGKSDSIGGAFKG
jgi:hypothetical protein